MASRAAGGRFKSWQGRTLDWRIGPGTEWARRRLQTDASQLCSQFPRSASELLLFETRECCMSRAGVCMGIAAPWLRCQHCNSAADRNSPASSVRSVFGVMQDTAVAVQNNTART